MAQSLNTPDVLTQPIATNGTKNSIPNTNDQSLGLMSQSTGFPPICSERIADGGKAPRRADFNGAFNLVTQQHFFFQNGGTETFRQDVSDAIGGYPLNARLWYTDSNNESVIVRSLIQNNTYNFNTTPSYIDGIHWVVDVESGAPVGAVMPYAGSTPPDGWLLCDGSEISRTNYARLFSVIGTTYGAGDGNSSFNLPTANDFPTGTPETDAGSTLNWGNSGTTYTATKNGFFCVYSDGASGSNVMAELQNTSTKIGILGMQHCWYYGGWGAARIFTPAKKGDVVILNYVGSFSTKYLVFLPDRGQRCIIKY